MIKFHVWKMVGLGEIRSSTQNANSLKDCLRDICYSLCNEKSREKVAKFSGREMVQFIQKFNSLRPTRAVRYVKYIDEKGDKKNFDLTLTLKTLERRFSLAALA